MYIELNREKVCLRFRTWTLTSTWKKVWPESVAGRNFQTLEHEVPVEEEIVSLRKLMGLVLDERDVYEPQGAPSGTGTEELQEFQSQLHSGVLREIVLKKDQR
ncbi:hypothetical protein WA026_006525 [Henosepilachna vigintioctopunctata]|uniref:Uncharacterized protein n=1 Tax=Henosepilachna vigintioctopunctata TaxID=420089 RepID=A0AAW1U935_9CUCU